MKHVPSALLAAALSVALFPATASAQTSFRCKTDLVNVGDGKASALLKCGEPLVKDSFCKPVDKRPVAVAAPSSATVVVNAGVCETVEEWTYNPGYGQFLTTLRFESGKLVAIKYGDRVK